MWTKCGRDGVAEASFQLLSSGLVGVFWVQNRTFLNRFRAQISDLLSNASVGAGVAFRVSIFVLF